ncbi:hypothetical protein LJC10_05470 [Selenomonadales bacterium OttesenSCG-928-I06]|nr:hypothetical protein [Selenomonadales bacterium OttesenSCG-928-I06]
MTVSYIANKIVYYGCADNENNVYRFDFKYDQKSDIRVALIDPEGVTTILTQDYFVDDINSTVVYPDYVEGQEVSDFEKPPFLQEGYKLVIYRQTALDQPNDLGDKHPMPVMEKMYDKLTMMIQDQQEELDRAVKADVSYEGGDSLLEFQKYLDEAVRSAENAASQVGVVERLAQDAADSAEEAGQILEEIKHFGTESYTKDESDSLFATFEDIPASLPADGGNADTVDGKHAADNGPDTLLILDASAKVPVDTLPVANASALGVIRVGSGLSISEQGTLSSNSYSREASDNRYIKIGDIDLSSLDVYTKTESDVRYNQLLNEISTVSGNSYSKTEIDSNFYTKANINNDFYTRIQVDSNFYSKAVADSRYVKQTDSINAVSVANRVPGHGAGNLLILDSAGKVAASDLPVASASVLGAIKVGAGLSIDEDGVLTSYGSGGGEGGSGDGYSRTEADARFATIDSLNVVANERYTKSEVDVKFETINSASSKYARKEEIPTSLPADGGNADSVAGRVPGTGAGNLVYLDSNAKISDSSLQIASDLRLGVIRVGAGLSINGSGILSNLSYTKSEADSKFAVRSEIPAIPESLPADGGNADTVDGVHADNNKANTLLILNSYAEVPSASLPLATASAAGAVKVGSGLNITDGVLSSTVEDVSIATEDELGVIRVGNGLKIDEEGVLSYSAVQVEVQAILYASQWTQDGRYVYQDENFTADNVIEIIPAATITESEYSEFQLASIIGVEQNAESITLRAMGIIPAIDIPVVILISSVGAECIPTASTTQLGVIKVGSGLSIDDDGFLSTTEPGGISEIPIATASVLGGIKVGSNLNITADGTLSGAAPYILPVATSSAIGGVKPGANLSVSADGTLNNTYSYTLPKATASTLGGVKVGTGLSVSSGTLSVPTASSSVAGIVKVGEGLAIENGVLSASLGGLTDLPVATRVDLGGVKVGDGLVVDTSGVLTAEGTLQSTIEAVLYATGWTASNTYTYENQNISANNMVEFLPHPSITLEALKTAQKANIIGISQAVGSITLKAMGDIPGVDIPIVVVIKSVAAENIPMASATELGGIKIGEGLSIDANGVVTGAEAYTLPTASASILGGVKVGDGLSISNGVLNADVKKSNICDATLLINNWVPSPLGDGSIIYTYSNSSITADSAIEMIPGLGITQEQLAELQEANIIDESQSAGSIVLKIMGELPTANIPVRFIIRGDL